MNNDNFNFFFSFKYIYWIEKWKNEKMKKWDNHILEKWKLVW